MPSPCLVLLDLNMPRMGGIEFLDELRRDPLLRRTLVFVMTTSSAEEDRVRAYDRNVAGYIMKHRPGETFLEAIGHAQSLLADTGVARLSSCAHRAAWQSKRS